MRIFAIRGKQHARRDFHGPPRSQSFTARFCRSSTLNSATSGPVSSSTLSTHRFPQNRFGLSALYRRIASAVKQVFSEFVETCGSRSRFEVGKPHYRRGFFINPRKLQAMHSANKRRCALVDAVYDWARFNSVPRGSSRSATAAGIARLRVCRLRSCPGHRGGMHDRKGIGEGPISFDTSRGLRA